MKIICKWWLPLAIKIASKFPCWFKESEKTGTFQSIVLGCYLQSQPKVSGHPQKKALPRFPSFNVATMMSTFLSVFFEPAKQHWAGGMGEKEATVQFFV